jgi:hypothetical protein
MGRKATNVCVWSFTYQETVDNQLPPQELIQNILVNLDAKAYVFQEEIGKGTKRAHYQGNLRLKEPMTMSNLREKFRSGTRRVGKSYFGEGCLTLTPTHDLSKSGFYCMKEDTRVKGPWVFPHWTYLGQDCLSQEQMYPWQKEMYDQVINKPPHDRHIHFIVDDEGNTGKSAFTKTLGFRHDAVVIPLGLSSAQVKAAITNAGAAQLYILDLPRNNSSWKDIFDTIEEIKRGFVISSFHGKLKTLFMFRPHIVCFSNVQPDLKLLSRDMWRIYHITRPALELEESKLFVSDIKKNIYTDIDEKVTREMEEHGGDWNCVPSIYDAIDVEYKTDGIIFGE